MSREPTPGSVRAEWRRRSRRTPMAGEEAARQGAISKLAFLLLGREQAISFLNTNHDGLGGRPLAVATSSPSGLADVEAELSRMTYRSAAAE